MNRGRGRARRSNANSATSVLARKVNLLTLQAAREHGGSVPIPRDPPAFVVNPWNKLVVAHGTTTITSSAEDYLTLSELRGQLLGRLNIQPASNNEIEIRLLKLQVWNVTGGDVTLRLYDPFTASASDKNCVFERTDVAGRVGWACVAIRVPLFISQNSVKPGAAGAVGARNYCSISTSASTGQQMAFRATVLWKCTAGSAPA